MVVSDCVERRREGKAADRVGEGSVREAYRELAIGLNKNEIKSYDKIDFGTRYLR